MCSAVPKWHDDTPSAFVSSFKDMMPLLQSRKFGAQNSLTDNQRGVVPSQLPRQGRREDEG